MGERSDMGLYDVLLLSCLPSFGTGTIFANFHACGMVLVFNATL